MRVRRSLLIFFVLVFFSARSDAQAKPIYLKESAPDTEKLSPSLVNVRVRTIAASLLSKDGSEQLLIDQALGDLRKQLEKLPFRSFKVITSDSQLIPLMRKEVLKLPTGDVLSYRPLYFKENRISLWLNWVDKEGNRVLDTRIHFNPDQSVIVGTERAEENGIVLAIDVSEAKD